MLWSVVVGVAVAAMAMTGCVGTLQRTSLVGQGYEDVVVGLSAQLQESEAGKIIEALKVTLNETSHTLFKATGNKLFFKKVKILIPSTWKTVPVDQAATKEVYEASHMRVDKLNKVYGHQVYTVQPGGCGQPGRHIHVTPKYLTHSAAPFVWGPRGKVLAQAWARQRWGIFDEVGYANDLRYPLFYHMMDRRERIVLKPNYCADETISGRYVDTKTRGSCTFKNHLPNTDCRFMPDNNQTATSSLMSFTKLASIEDFCDDSLAEARSHNSEAPNRHNEMCSGRSAWEVMLSHSDFKNAVRLPANHPVVPEVLVVQQQKAAFALVLDYSGSMDGEKISVLVNTARRWLLHDVEDGSFVSIIKFSDNASVHRPLTEVSSSTRKSLADAITSDPGGSTCIGCGLETALQTLQSKSNKVIILITDGGENSNPRIADVMDMVVQSAVRVVTISYGISAEATLESLAQNTGGKTYIVPDNDDGSFMKDAFQGSLTYQPTQSILNTNIKIHEYDEMVRGMASISSSFSIDNTMGRNLEFQLETTNYINEPPYLTSPSGKIFTSSTFNRALNLWIIKLENTTAETGKWIWTKSLQSQNTKVKVTVTAQARDAQTLPIVTHSWISTGEDFVDASKQRLIVYGEVKQGENPVVGAKVKAYITTPDDTVEAVQLDLLDNGQGADVQAGDGIYSRYFTKFISTGRYGVKAQVSGDGNAFINNGFIAPNTRRRRNVQTPHSRSRRTTHPDDELVVYEHCCGSVVPFDRLAAVPTGNFTRSVAAGSFNNECLRMCLGALRCTRVERMEVEANIPPLETRRDALLLAYGVATARKAPLGIAASTVIRRHHHLHDAVCRPVSVRLNLLCQHTGLRLDDADLLVLPSLAPWKPPPTTINTNWLPGRKAAVAEAELHHHFRVLVAGLPPSLHLYTDGSKAGECVGASVWSNECALRFRLPSHTSVFSSELFAIDKAIDYALNSPQNSIVIFSDSKSALQAIESGYTDTNEIQGNIINKLNTCRKSFSLIWVPGHSRINGNEQADMLAKSAAELEGAWNLRRDLQSCLSAAKSSVKLLWQSKWDNLHLNTTKPILGEWASSNRHTRREEVVLARLRMGCTLPTHMLPYIAQCFPPQCSTCKVVLSIKHILLHCVRYRESRRSIASYCMARRLPITQTTLLGDEHPDVVDRLMIFLTETKLIREL